MKFQPVNPVPGNYEGIYSERSDYTSSRETRETLNLYVSPTRNKTYKPFNDSINIPPIETPIILNPNYRDVLENNDINHAIIHDADLRRKELAVKIIVDRLKYVQSRAKDSKRNLYQSKSASEYGTTIQNQHRQKYETKNNIFESESKKESKKDIQSIKMTALNIIEENIKKAVSVAEQIKQEIDVEMTGQQQERRETRQGGNFRNNEEYIKRSAFSLGLKTIPYMKTYMQSNRFHSMLIKRIFLQLTNFMLSLTKHISKYFNTFRISQNDITEEGEYYESTLSGAEMSRKFGKTPLEFTKRMDTVITEFEKRTGIKQTTTRRSRSRSRNTVNDNLFNGDFVNGVYSNVDGKNIYRAFVTEEWSEYYDLKQPEIIKTIKSDKYTESEIIKKETIEKLVEEKIQKDYPQTYIAIVQAHVFTNHDAIIRDIQEEKHDDRKSIETYDFKKESIIQTKEQCASYNELEHQTIRINKEKPIDKVVVVESIEDITPVDEYKTFPSIEQIKTGVAVHKTTEVLEPVTELQADKLANVSQAHHTIEPSSITIAGSKAVVLKQEKDDSFVLSESKPRKSVALIEPPLKSIAETTKIDILEPELQILDTTQQAYAKPITSIETPIKTIAQVSQIEVNEPKSKPLNLIIPNEVKSKELVQTPVQSVAVKTETFTDQPKIDHIDALQPKEENFKMILEPLTTTVAKKSEVYIDESATTFDKKELHLQHVKRSIEVPLQTVAQNLETHFNESYEDIKDIQVRSQNITSTTESISKGIARTNQTILSERTTDFQSAMSNTESIQKTIEPMKSIAESFEIYVNDNGEDFNKFKAKGTEPEITIEAPVRVIAETNETMTDEVTGFIEKIKLPKERIEPQVIPSSKPVAEVCITLMDEASGIYEKDKLETRNPQFMFEIPVKTLAEINEPCLNELSKPFDKKPIMNTEKIDALVEISPKTLACTTEINISEEVPKVFEPPKINTVLPDKILNLDFKAVPEISEIILSDLSETIETPDVNTDKTKVILEIPVKTVAEKTEVFVDKLEIQTLESTGIQVDKTHATIETPIKTVAEKSIVKPNEPMPSHLEIKSMDLKTPKVVMDDSLRFVPETAVSIPEGPKLQSFELPKPREVEGKITVDKLEPTIISQVLLAEPTHIPLDVPQVKIKTSRSLIEEPRLTVPEICMPPLQGPKDGTFLVSKTSEGHANLNLNTSAAAAVTEIVVLEPQCRKLELPEIKEREYHTSIEDVKLSVTQVQQNVILGPKDEIFEVPSTVKTKASLKLNEERALEGSLVVLEETITKKAESKTALRQPKVFVEGSTKTVAGNLQVKTAESEKSFSVKREATEHTASLKVQSLASLAQTSTIPLEEIRIKEEPPEIIRKQAKVSMQEFSSANIAQTVALSSVKDEKFRSYQDVKKIESKIESMEKAKASVNEVDVKLSKVEITEVTDDKYEKVDTGYKVELAEDETEKVMLDTEFIKKDIEYMENGMASIIQSVDADLKTKVKKSKVAISEVKVSESEGSKSPSPLSPVNDVYLFCVATPYARHETETETPIVELDYKSTPKRRYTQADISVAHSIAIEYQVSDTEDEVESIEIDYEYEKHQYQTDINVGEIIANQKSDIRMEEQSSEYAVQKQRLHRDFNKAMQVKHETATLIAGSEMESASKSQVSQHSSLRQGIEAEKDVDQSAKRKSIKSKSKSSKTLQQAKAIFESESQEASLEISGHQNLITHSEMQSLEQNREAVQQDIKVIEKDIESRHALLSEHSTSKHLASQESMRVQAEIITSNQKTKQIEGVNEKAVNQELKSPPVEPATPLTDEYVFRLTAPLPSREGTPVPRDCTSSSSSEAEEEIRRKLIPHMELSIEQRIFDPPLPTPPTSPPVTVTSTTSSSRSKPFYSKPGLRGGGNEFDLTKEEVLEIGRQSTLLASAIDNTIKKIEEYKSEAGIMECASSEISSSVQTVNEYREENKVEVLIDKMVETSRRFSGEGEESGSGQEFVVPIVQEYTPPQETKSPEFSTNFSTKEVVKENKMETQLSDQLLHSVKSMVDPNASVEDRLAQMQSQIAELSRLPDLIQKTLSDVRAEFEKLNYEVQQKAIQTTQVESIEEVQVEKTVEPPQEQPSIEVTVSEIKDVPQIPEPDTEIQAIIDRRRLEAESKTRDEIMKERLSQELRIAAERLSPKLGFDERPKRGFSPLPQTEAMGVPPKPTVATAAFGETPKPGKVWKKTDNYDDDSLEQMLSETLAAQAEVIKGNAIGVNFMKYEKPPPPLEHLQNSEVYKAIHDMDQKPLKKVELLKPAIAASDYVERLRSVSPAPSKTLIEDCEV